MNDERIWKMPIKSGREDFEVDPSKVSRARAFCFEKGWVGIGWGCDGLQDDSADASQYEQEVRTQYADDPSGLYAHRAFSNVMQIGDFVWCRARGDIYWLGRIEGAWRYRNIDEFDQFDLYQVRSCRWHKVGTSDTVPGFIKNAYAGRGPAISQIQKERESARHMTLAIWERVTGKPRKDSPYEGKFSLSLVGHDDLEDLVALYLQAELGWYVVPSTAKRSTPFTEFVLLNSRGERAYVQVKSGRAEIALEEVPVEIDTFFIFDLNSDKLDVASQRVKRIDPAQLIKFCRKNATFLPQYMQGLVFDE
jgi:hypothetical protein